MKDGDKIFVYGTLRQGEGADLSRDKRARFITEDRINGRLYNLGWFPGVRPLDRKANDFDPSLDQVVGEVFEIVPPEHGESLQQRLDRYEGYPSLYDRIQVETSKSHLVWVYIYNGDPADNKRILSGDWLNQEVVQ
jgi:gamma-glutamylcyclotransferase (GGCT)/AIG2-like uncharacterized protein YtfP